MKNIDFEHYNEKPILTLRSCKALTRKSFTKDLFGEVVQSNFNKEDPTLVNYLMLNLLKFQVLKIITVKTDES